MVITEEDVIDASPAPDYIIDWWRDDEPEPMRIEGDNLDKVLEEFKAVEEPVERAEGIITSKDGEYIIILVYPSVAKKGQRDQQLFEELERQARLISKHTLQQLKDMKTMGTHTF